MSSKSPHLMVYEETGGYTHEMNITRGYFSGERLGVIAFWANKSCTCHAEPHKLLDQSRKGASKW